MFSLLNVLIVISPYRLEKNNVMITGQLDVEFPLARFDLVIEYECSAQHENLAKLCERQKIKHIELQMVSCRTRGPDKKYTGKFNTSIILNMFSKCMNYGVGNILSI